MPKTRTINLLLMDGGLGDHVCSLVAVDYIHKQYPWIKPIIWMPDFLVSFAKHLLKSDAVVYGFSQMKHRYEPSKPTKTTKWDGNTSPMKIHCLDYAFLRLCDENPGLEFKNYLKINPNAIDIAKFELPEKYVVITTGYTANVREFIPPTVNKIAQYVLEQGYMPVFLGQMQTKTGAAHVIEGKFSPGIDYKAGISLIDRTTLLEAAKIMSEAKAVVGVDNGLLHVAGCTDATIVGAYTTVSPEIRMPVRYSVLGWNCYPVIPDLACRFCQEKTNFIYGHDYRKCYRVENKEIAEIACVSNISASKFINKLNEIFNAST